MHKLYARNSVRQHFAVPSPAVNSEHSSPLYWLLVYLSQRIIKFSYTCKSCFEGEKESLKSIQNPAKMVSGHAVEKKTGHTNLAPPKTLLKSSNILLS